ncbi:UPF0158 family protein [Neobacillus sp. PS3-40]|uniref:UPF0158 family protein n=1 Tax=Neobacillus sp. PS3-40 TaxID=3070679 RepID=UPI0027E12D7F|nr:UPF0158 family protein [Neobacillus sp. PS3-40]WML46065.1 UPF0158 family protein [Neobacillus sp. PS3-40]
MNLNLLDQLIDTYLLNDMDEAYYDVKEKPIVYDWEDDETAESEIDWDDEENCERYELIPLISTFESFRLMEQFADSVDDDRKSNMLFQALRKSKPFRRFKDTLLELGIRDEWFALEY